MAFFHNHSAEVLQRLKATKHPVVLTVNANAAAVIQRAEAYQYLIDLAAEASAAEGNRRADQRCHCAR